MEPRQSGSGGGIEGVPAPTSAFESSPASGRQIEIGRESRPETQLEVGAVQAEAAQVAMPALPMPVLTVNSGSGQQLAAMPVSDDAPISASDDDLIEKEWVDKAKKILAETKDDPYRRESEVNKLQIDYIRKRYGREIGSASDE